MHSTILISRRAAALKKLIESAEAIVKHLELDPSLLDGFAPQGVKDQQVKDMLALESAAKIMHELAVLSHSIQDESDVTTVTATDDSSADMTEETPTVEPVFPDDLPAPVLDEQPTPANQAIPESAEESAAPLEEDPPATTPEAEPVVVKEEVIEETTESHTTKKPTKKTRRSK